MEGSASECSHQSVDLVLAPATSRRPTNPGRASTCAADARLGKKGDGDVAASRVSEGASAFAYTGSEKKRARDTVGSGKESAAGSVRTRALLASRLSCLLQVEVYGGVGDFGWMIPFGFMPVFVVSFLLAGHVEYRTLLWSLTYTIVC